MSKFPELNILVLGSREVGKTSVIKKLKDELLDPSGYFHVKPISDIYTLGKKRSMNRNSLHMRLSSIVSPSKSNREFKVNFFEVNEKTLANPKQRFCYYPMDINVILLVFAMDNPQSFKDIVKKWRNDAKSINANIPTILVGNKLDTVEGLRNERVIPVGDCLRVMQSIKALEFIEFFALSRSRASTHPDAAPHDMGIKFVAKCLSENFENVKKKKRNDLLWNLLWSFCKQEETHCNEIFHVLGALKHIMFDKHKAGNKGKVPLKLACYSSNLVLMVILMKVMYDAEPSHIRTNKIVVKLLGKLKKKKRKLPKRKQMVKYLNEGPAKVTFLFEKLFLSHLNDNNYNLFLERYEIKSLGMDMKRVEALDNVKKVMQRLVKEKRVNSKVVDETGNTPIHEYARKGEEAYLVEMLNFKQVKLNLQNKAGDTVLHIAAKKKGVSDGVIQKMVAAGAKLNIRNRAGETPFYRIIKYGRTLKLIEWCFYGSEKSVEKGVLPVVDKNKESILFHLVRAPTPRKLDILKFVFRPISLFENVAILSDRRESFMKEFFKQFVIDYRQKNSQGETFLDCLPVDHKGSAMFSYLKQFHFLNIGKKKETKEKVDEVKTVAELDLSKFTGVDKGSFKYKLWKIYEEILLKEEKYVKDLEFLHREYFEPILDWERSIDQIVLYHPRGKGGIEEAKQKVKNTKILQVIKSVECIVEITKKLLVIMRRNIPSDASELTAKNEENVLVEFTKAGNCGTELNYYKFYSQIKHTKTDFRGNEMLYKLLDGIDKRLCKVGKMGLDSYFILPVQHLPRYELFMRSLMKKYEKFGKTDQKNYSLINESIKWLKSLLMKIDSKTFEQQQNRDMIVISRYFLDNHKTQILSSERTKRLLFCNDFKVVDSKTGDVSLIKMVLFKSCVYFSYTFKREKEKGFFSFERGEPSKKVLIVPLDFVGCYYFFIKLYLNDDLIQYFVAKSQFSLDKFSKISKEADVGKNFLIARVQKKFFDEIFAFDMKLANEEEDNLPVIPKKEDIEIEEKEEEEEQSDSEEEDSDDDDDDEWQDMLIPISAPDLEKKKKKVQRKHGDGVKAVDENVETLLKFDDFFK